MTKFLELLVSLERILSSPNEDIKLKCSMCRKSCAPLRLDVKVELMVISESWRDSINSFFKDWISMKKVGPWHVNWRTRLKVKPSLFLHRMSQKESSFSRSSPNWKVIFLGHSILPCNRFQCQKFQMEDKCHHDNSTCCLDCQKGNRTWPRPARISTFWCPRVPQLFDTWTSCCDTC